MSFRLLITLIVTLLINGCISQPVKLKTQGETYQELKYIVDNREGSNLLDFFGASKPILESGLNPSPVLTFDISLNNNYSSKVLPNSINLIAFHLTNYCPNSCNSGSAWHNSDAQDHVECTITAKYQDTTFSVHHEYPYSGYHKVYNYDFAVRGVVENCINDAVGKIAEIHDSTGLEFYQKSTFGNIPVYGNLTEIVNQNDRLEASGITVLPPQENGWYFVQKSNESIEFFKPSLNGQFFTGRVQLSPLPDLNSEEEFVELLWQQGSKSPQQKLRYRYTVNEKIPSTEKGTLGVRFHSKYKDFGVTHFGSAYYQVEDFGVTFQHPDNNNIAVTIVLSQRSRAGDFIENFDALAEEFISNLELTALKK